MKIDLSLQFALGLTIVKSYNIRLRKREIYEVKVYLIHFDEPLGHAQHYLGSTENLAVRMNEHRKGEGARILQVLNEKGTGYKIARVWHKATRDLESKLKRANNNRRLCPICNPLLTIEKFIDPETI